jgi:hypothetical protein
MKITSYRTAIAISVFFMAHVMAHMMRFRQTLRALCCRMCLLLVNVNCYDMCRSELLLLLLI